MLQQIIDRRLAGQEQVDRQPRALPAPLPGADRATRCGARSTAAASATSSRAKTSASPSATSASRCSATARAARARSCTRATRSTCAATASSGRKGGGGSGSGKGAGRRLRRGRGRLRLPPHQGRVHADLLRRPGAAAPDRARSSPRRPRWKSHRAGFVERRHAEQPARGALDARRDRPAHRDRRRLARASCASSRSELAELPRGRATPPRRARAKSCEREIAALRARLDAHSLPRPDRPALSQPRARAGARPPRR